jgi:hypothetical protein
MNRAVDFVHNDFVHEAASLLRHEHLAAFFKTGDFLASRVAWFVAEGLATGDQVGADSSSPASR